MRDLDIFFADRVEHGELDPMVAAVLTMASAIQNLAEELHLSLSELEGVPDAIARLSEAVDGLTFEHRQFGELLSCNVIVGAGRIAEGPKKEGE